MKADLRIKHIKPLRRNPLKTQSFKNRVNGNKITIKEDKIYVNGKFSHMSTRHRVTDEEIASLHPKMREDVANLINEVNNIQNEFWIQAGNLWENEKLLSNAGNRTNKQQNNLFSVGRDRYGNIIGKIKTKVKAPLSYHNHGLAIDLALIINGVANYHIPTIKPLYEKYIFLNMKKYGFESGKNFKGLTDYPHIQKTFGYKIKQLVNKLNLNQTENNYVRLD